MIKWFKSKINIARDVDTPASKPDPEAAGALKTAKQQGDSHVKAGRYADAERHYRQVVASDPDYPDSLVMLGFALREQGRIPEARVVLESAVRYSAEDADSHYLLASVLEGTGPFDIQIAHLQKALDLRPDFEIARCQLVGALHRSSRIAEAVQLCDAGLAISPGSPELHLLRGTLHLSANDTSAAIASFRQVLALNPEMIAAQQNLSRLLLDTEQFEQAERSYRREIELTPQHFGPRHMLGVLLIRMGRYAEAIESLKGAISLNRDSGASHSSLAAAYIGLDDSSESNLALARENFEIAAALEPKNSEILYNLGLAYWRLAQLDRSLASFDKAIEADPSNAKARWARVMLWAPAFSSSDNNSSSERSGFGSELGKFEEWWRKSEADGASFVGELQPFYLTYQEKSNLELLKQYGFACAAAMHRWLGSQKEPAFKRPIGTRIRLGIVSADIRVHSNWIALIKGWLQSFDTERFEVIVFSLANQIDAETAWARAKSDVFVGGQRNLSQWVSAILEQNCEVLLFPAIGLDPMTMKLASLRLAQVQINSWGHADTSGLPTIDYYVSAECFEPASAQENYSEKLVLLPHLGNRVQPLNLESSDPDFAALNIDLEKPILICPGTPFKYQPEHDHVFAEIAQRVPGSQFIFFLWSGAALARVVKARIIREFEKAGLDPTHHVRFVRWLKLPEFHCLLRHADVLLDTIGFSGYNNALQAMECGLPMVTLEGKFLRGRLASGVLRRMNLLELIVQSKADYVHLVAKLVQDNDYRARICEQIQQRRSVLFDDLAAIGPLQDFLESVARPALTSESR